MIGTCGYTVKELTKSSVYMDKGMGHGRDAFNVSQEAHNNEGTQRSIEQVVPNLLALEHETGILHADILC